MQKPVLVIKLGSAVITTTAGIIDETIIKKLAEENYKITEAKYLNQLAVQAEMIDAQNQKLQSELDYANAEINVLYQYYNLLKSTGTL